MGANGLSKPNKKAQIFFLSLHKASKPQKGYNGGFKAFFRGLTFI